MLTVLSKKILIIFTCLLIIVTCASCKNKDEYLIGNFIKDLAYSTGISISEDLNEAFEELKKWDVVKEEDRNLFKNVLTYDYLSEIIERILNENDGFKYLKEEKLISNDMKVSSNVDESTAIKVIKNITGKLNNPDIINSFNIEEKDVKHLNDYSLSNDKLTSNELLLKNEIVYLENDQEYKKIKEVKGNYYLLENPELDEIISSADISGSEVVDFEDAEIIPYDDESTSFESSYINNNYTLLATRKKKFAKNGFDVSYSINSGGLDVHISKSKNNSPTLFFDINLSNVKPTYKWKYKDGKIENAFFKINYKLTNEVGVSTGKYNNYYLDFKNKDAPSFLGFVRTSLRSMSKDDEIEATIPICKIKTSIPNVPFAYFNMDVLAKFYVSGKVEVVVYNDGVVGFEIKDNKFRVVHDIDRDVDSIIGASAKAVVGLNFNIESSKYRLMDVELDGGVRASVSTTLHMYDKDGNKTEEEVDVPYAIVDLVAKENDNIKVCGDVSLNWVLDLEFNTSKTVPYKYGLTYKKSFLGTSNQIFKNKTHIENWQFVKYCTRKNRSSSKTQSTTKVDSNKITLKKYSAVVIKGESYEIPIVSLPSGYNEEDLVFTSNNTSVVTCNGKYISAHDIGSTSIDIKTKDNKYKASINILVSTG